MAAPMLAPHPGAPMIPVMSTGGQMAIPFIPQGAVAPGFLQTAHVVEAQGAWPVTGNASSQKALTQIPRVPSDGGVLEKSTATAIPQPVDEQPGRRTRGRGFSVVFAKATADPKAAGRFRPLTIIACFKFDQDLDVEVARSLVKVRLVDKFPKFRCKVTFKGMCSQHFEELPLSALDMQYHVTPEASQGWDAAAVDNLFASLYAQDKDYDRPLWRFHILNGLAAGGSMMVANVDHAVGDGIGMVQVLASLFDPAPAPSPAAGPAQPEPLKTPVSANLNGGEGGNGLHTKAKPKSSLGTMRWMKAKVKGTAQGLGQIFMFKDRKTVMVVNDIFKPSQTKSFAVSAKIDLQQIKDIKNKVPGGSVNDVVATVVNLALHRYLTERADPIVTSRAAVRASYPVNLRRPGETRVANEIATSLLAMDFDFEKRTDVLFRIKRRMDEPLIERALLKIAAAVLPTNMLLNLAVWLFTKFSIMISNVPGPQSLQHFAGQPLADLYYFLFVPLGVYVGTLSYNGKVTFTIAADPQVEGEPTKFIKYISSEFDALHAEVMAHDGMLAPPSAGCCG